MRISDWSSDVCSSDLDPVAKVDMRRLRLLCCLDQRKHDKGAERASGLVWVEEAVDRGRSIAQPVEQAHRHQPALPVAKLGKACVDIAGLNHVAIFLLGHPRHLAIAMARVDVAA